MGIWDRFGSRRTGSNNTEEMVPWRTLTEVGQLDEVISASHERTQVIFKHSRTCGISSMARRRFEQTADDFSNHFEFYFLTIQDHRQLSNEIASRFQVRHESPQLLVLKNGAVVRHASHWQIDGVSLEDFQ